MVTRDYLIVFCFILTSCLVMGQGTGSKAKSFTVAELNQDLTYLKTLLIAGHPGLFWYSSINDFSEAIEKLDSDIKSDMTELEFLNHVAVLNGTIKCSHSDIRASASFGQYWQDSVSLIPVNIMKIQSEYFISENLSEIKSLSVGTKLIAINDIPIQQIIAQLLPIIPADGENQSRKYHALKKGFYYYYSYYFNMTSKVFKITSENDKGEKIEHSVNGINKRTFNQRRKSLKSQDSPLLSFEVIDTLSAAVLKIPTFRNDLMEQANVVFEEFLISAFKKLREERIGNIVIDLRNNNGGYSEYGAQLYSFLSDTAFKYCQNQIVTTNQLIEGVKYDIPETFTGFPNGIEYIGEQYKWTTHSVLNWREPSVWHFSGNIYFLVNGGCSSTTSELLSLARYNEVGMMIGQEVGGSYSGNSGGVLGWFTLPHTKLRVRMGMVKFEIVDESKTNDNNLMPDVQIEYTIDDVLSGYDLELIYALKAIRAEHQKKTKK